MPAISVPSPLRLLATLHRHRELTWAMARRELLEQYAGRALGWLWTIGNPLLLIGLYVFLFAYVFPARMPDRGGATSSGASYTIFILAGLIPWLGFADSLNRSTGSIANNANLVRQVVFPVEALPAKSAIAAMCTQLVTTALLLLYMVAFGRGIPAAAIGLPVLLALQFVAMLGCAVLLATLTVFVRDLREVVAFLTSAGLFLAPILYMPEWVESLVPWARWLLALNPVTHLVHCHRDLLVDGAIVHPWSWAALTFFALTSLWFGAATYRRCHHVLGELL
ncbi:MAG: ABC transporter permease [Phycisphaerales bacterium]|jgi:lipopolysaccharide transport system permease protein